MAGKILKWGENVLCSNLHWFSMRISQEDITCGVRKHSREKISIKIKVESEIMVQLAGTTCLLAIFHFSGSLSLIFILGLILQLCWGDIW